MIPDQFGEIFKYDGTVSLKRRTKSRRDYKRRKIK